VLNKSFQKSAKEATAFRLLKKYRPTPVLHMPVECGIFLISAWGVNRHTVRHTGPMSMLLQLRSLAPPYGRVSKWV